MKIVRYTVGISVKVLEILGKRLFGKKHVSTWNLQTELIWATTRYTLISSNRFGLAWLKSLSSNYKPNAKFRSQFVAEQIQSGERSYLKITPKTDRKIENTIIYFHGGGYVTGSPTTIIEFISRLALRTNFIVLAPFYPTAPEELYPNAHVFSSKIVESIMNELQDNKFYLGGDSAGGTLVISVFKKLSTSNQSKVKGCFLISPWIEPTSTTGTIQTNTKKDVADNDYLINCYNTYVNTKEIQNKYPIEFSLDNLTRLPGTLITIGTNEMLLDQVIRLNENLKELNTETTLIKYGKMFHTFWNHPSKIQEADNLIEDIVKWIKTKTTHNNGDC